jgi:hypothetical protein
VAAKEGRAHHPNDLTQQLLLAPYAACAFAPQGVRQAHVLQGVVEGLGGPLGVAPILLQTFLSVTTAALASFGVFFRVSFCWGHDDLLRIVIMSIPDRKETMSHPISISHRQTMGDDPPGTRSYKPFMMNNFHKVSSQNPRQYFLTFKIGKARTLGTASSPYNM